MLLLRNMEDLHNVYFINSLNRHNSTNSSDGNKSNCVEYIKLSDFTKLYHEYKSADIAVIDDDPIIRQLFISNLNKYKIKSDISDIGRNIEIDEFKGSNQFLKKMIDYNSSYGLIIIDENLGPDSLSGCDIVRRLREMKYNGAILIVTSEFDEKTFDKLRDAGSNGIITKNKKDFFKEISKILQHLSTRNFKREY